MSATVIELSKGYALATSLLLAVTCWWDANTDQGGQWFSEQQQLKTV